MFWFFIDFYCCLQWFCFNSLFVFCLFFLSKPHYIILWQEKWKYIFWKFIIIYNTVTLMGLKNDKIKMGLKRHKILRFSLSAWDWRCLRWLTSLLPCAMMITVLVFQMKSQWWREWLSQGNQSYNSRCNNSGSTLTDYTTLQGHKGIRVKLLDFTVWWLRQDSYDCSMWDSVAWLIVRWQLWV